MARLRSLALAGIASGALFTGACGGVGKTIKRADGYMDDGRYSAAARTYTSALEKRPRDPDLLVAVAEAWIAADEPAQALDPARLAVHAEAEGAELVLAEALLSDGKIDEARPLVEQALASAEVDASAHFLDAEIRLASGDLSGAVNAVESGLMSSRGPRNSAFGAWVHSRAGNHDRATSLSHRASEAPEANAAVFAEAAAVHAAAGRTDRASELASRARTLSREDEERWLATAVRRQDSGDYEGAIRRVSWLQAVQPKDGEHPLLLAELWISRGGPAEALASLERARSLTPFNGLLASGEVQVTDSRVLNMSADERVSLLTRLHLAEAEAHRQLGNTSRSLASRQEALRLQPDGGPVAEWVVVGRGFMELRRFSEAIAAGTTATSLDPSSLDANVLLLRAHAATGAVDQAIAHGRAAWAASPGHAQVALLLSELYLARGEAREAAGVLEMALRANPDDTRLAKALQRVRQGG